MLKGQKIWQILSRVGIGVQSGDTIGVPYHPYFLKLRPYINLDYIVLIVDGLHGMWAAECVWYRRPNLVASHQNHVSFMYVYLYWYIFNIIYIYTYMLYIYIYMCCIYICCIYMLYIYMLYIYVVYIYMLYIYIYVANIYIYIIVIVKIYNILCIYLYIVYICIHIYILLCIQCKLTSKLHAKVQVYTCACKVTSNLDSRCVNLV